MSAGAYPGDFLDLLPSMTPEEVAQAVMSMPPAQAEALLRRLSAADPEARPQSPIALALALDEGYRAREHLRLISERLAAAVADVEAGRSRRLIIELPPRSGKTTLCTNYLPAWLLERHPDWSVVLTSHDGTLATSWGRQIRRWAETGEIGVEIAPDAGAVGEWETTAGGSLVSRSVRASLTGRGAKVLLVDDPHKDYLDAHSKTSRDSVWSWWQSVAQTRLEPPSLVVVVMTRWHEDDLVGRLLSTEYDGDPDEWERLCLPALAVTTDDPLGREPGAPLLSPIVDEDASQALERLEAVRSSVGAYTWSALYQQSPAPAEGAIFEEDWWRFWTSDPSRATADGRVVYLDPLVAEQTERGGTPRPGEEGRRAGARWLDSWDMAFKGTDSSDYVVGQRWLRRGAYRYLIAQERARLSFTETLAAMKRFSSTTDPLAAPYADQVHERLVEDKANGTAVMSVMQRELSGLIPINPRDGKEARARAITPEVESGNVLLPHPGDPGNGWVRDLLAELRNFPHDQHDDQVDALTQALSRLRDEGRGGISVPGRVAASAGRRTRASSLTSRSIGR